MNTLTITGNLGQDPQVHYTNEGRPKTTLNVAVNRRAKNPQTGVWEDQLDGWFTCIAWDVQAAALAHLKTGDRVIVTGRIVKRNWEDQNGNPRQTSELQITEAGPSFKFGTWPTQQSTPPPQPDSTPQPPLGNMPTPEQSPGQYL